MVMIMMIDTHDVVSYNSRTATTTMLSFNDIHRVCVGTAALLTDYR